MRVVYERCCGLDVHKKTVVACVLITEMSGEMQRHIRTFSTMTAGLLAAFGLVREHASPSGSHGVNWRVHASHNVANCERHPLKRKETR
jgi:hypothetical protein